MKFLKKLKEAKEAFDTIRKPETVDLKTIDKDLLNKVIEKYAKKRVLEKIEQIFKEKKEEKALKKTNTK